MQYHGWQSLIKTLVKNTIKWQIESSNTYIIQKAEQSTIEEIRKEQIVKEETKEYTTKNETTKETVKAKHNHLFVPAMHCSQITPLTERVYKDIL